MLTWEVREGSVTAFPMASFEYLGTQIYELSAQQIWIG